MEGNPNIRKAYESILNHDFEQAIEWFEQAIADEPNNASYHYRLSISYARSNKLKKAIEYAERACLLDSATEVYRLHLNTVLARQLLQKASELMKGNDSNYIQAISALQKATRLDPLSVEAFLLLSIAYEHSGRLDDSLSSVMEAIKLDPQHKEAGDWLQQLLRQMDNHTEHS